MPYCSPQRYLANDRNLAREATLTPSSVLPVDDSVRELPVARVGTGQVVLSGSYSGAESITLDVEVLDELIDVANISAPVATGAGSGALSNIVATGTPQTYTVQLHDAGLPFLNAGIDFEGVRIVARAAGTAGNGIEIEVDQTTLTFTAEDFSLLEELTPGDGGESSGIKGAAFDWDTKVIGVDDVIPATAHRVAFGDDRGDIYLQYKKYVDGEWVYHFVPEIKRTIPKGARVSFVTDGRVVTVFDPSGPTTETFPGIVTVYDLLNILFTTSALVTVEGVIANDRSPTGMAAKELAIRTDAHTQPSTGTGSAAATGFVDVFANDNAATELVVATCFAVTAVDHPLARLGAERWKLKGSVSGELGEIVTAEPFTAPDASFGLTIPQRLPDGYGVQRGRFSILAPLSLNDSSYVSRDIAEKPPICPVALTLGTEAVDQTITLEWTQRPTGDCVCSGMPIPVLDRRCLGLFDTEGESMAYQADTIVRLAAFYDWAADTTAALTAILPNYTNPVGAIAREAVVLQDPVGITDSSAVAWTDPKLFQEIVSEFEATIAEIDEVTDTTLRTNGMDVWDDAVVELQADVVDLLSGSPRLSLRDSLYSARLNSAIAAAGISQVGGADASIIESGDGCWRDLGGDYWTVTGSAKGEYAPAFNNAPYYASRLSDDGRAYFSTKEFGFQINIQCPELLEYGDRVILTIGDAGWGATYVVGDELTLPIIAAQPQILAGGQDGNSDLVWYVSGTVDGPLANFTYSPSASPPGDYSDSGLAFTYTPGGIPNEAGDKFVFSVEGGHWRYRIDSGPWVVNSPSDDIDNTVQTFIDGLSIQFLTGAAPSFVTGDVYSFRVAQPWAVSNLQTPHRYRWQWDEAAPSLVFDLLAVESITLLAIARHTLPAGATILVEGGTVSNVYTWSETLTWAADAIVKEFAAQSAQYLRLTLGAATGGGIGWFYAGLGLSTTLSAELDLRRVYKIQSDGQGLDQGGKYLGRARSGTIEWTEAALDEDDVEGIAAMLDWLKEHDDEAFVVVPQITRPEEAFTGYIAVDDVQFAELSGYNREAGIPRRYSISLPFAGAWR